MTDAAAPHADSSKPADTPKPASSRKPLPPYSRRLRRAVDPIGSLLADMFHLVGLFAIGAATVWASVRAFLTMVKAGSANLEDLLLLFIYLEIGSMVGIYFRTNHMPVRFLIYVAITALTRHMIVYVQGEGGPAINVLIMTGGTLILSVAVLIIRYASHHYPSRSGVEATEDG
jgi:phosphate starvation-inducible membrane PsiE